MADRKGFSDLKNLILCDFCKHAEFSSDGDYGEIPCTDCTIGCESFYIGQCGSITKQKCEEFEPMTMQEHDMQVEALNWELYSIRKGDME